MRGRGRAEQLIREAAHAYRRAFGGIHRTVETKETSTTIETIDASPDHLAVLQETLEFYLADFRREVASTEPPRPAMAATPPAGSLRSLR